MTLTTDQLSAVETTKEFRALLKYMRAIAKAEPESVKEKFELEEGLWRYASQKAIKAIVGHINALEFALANREAQPVLYASEETLAYAKEGEKSLVTWSEPMGDAVIPLYTAPPAPAVPDDYRHLKNVQELYHSQEERLFALAQRIKGASFDKYSHTTAQAIDMLEREIFGDDDNACRAVMLKGERP